MSDVDFDKLLFNELREHVFGLGLISLRYNVFEYALKFLIFNYTEPAIADLLFDKASNEQRANAIRRLVNDMEKDPEVIAHTEHLLTFFSICSENRNVLMHSSQSWVTTSSEAITLEKRLKSGGKSVYQLDLRSIKRVANDMIDGTAYLMGIDRLKTGSRPFSSLGDPSWKRSTSLQKPPLPDKLNRHQPAVNLKGEPPQPEASEE
jgi:hypothetical protein